MTASYPGSIKTYSNKTDGVDYVMAADVNSVYDEVTALETFLRRPVTGNTTYYVRTDGNDANSGLVNNAAGAFLTIQRAVNIVSFLDLNSYTVTIQVGDGTYTGAVTISTPFVGGFVVIQGNSGTPGNVIISTTSASCFTNTSNIGSTITIKDMELRTTTSGNCIVQQGGGILAFTNIRFGACAGYHVFCNTKIGQISGSSAYAITGNAVMHYNAQAGAIFIPSCTVTVSASLTFTTFAQATRTGFLSVVSTTFSTNVATGTRYNADINSVIYTAGGSGTLFPGNSAGTTATGGLYV